MKKTLKTLSAIGIMALGLAFTFPEKPSTTVSTPEATQTEDTTIYYVNQVSVQPEFKGGKSELIKFLRSNVKYPKAAELNGKQGTVMVEMLMEKDGSFSFVKTVNKPFGFGLEEEAIRVMKLSEGKWKVAKINDQPVRIRWVYPIKFSLY
jgi:TonB family protein